MLKFFLTLLLVFAAAVAHADGSPAALTTDITGVTQRFAITELLHRPDLVTIQVEHDMAYQRAMTYQAIPLSALLKSVPGRQVQHIETMALDGFVSILPADLALNTDQSKAVAMLAIEDPAHPWPALPGNRLSAGPLYIVWVGVKASQVRSEQWPYQVARLAESLPPAERWPQLAVDASLARNDARRLGQEVFAVQCLVCHKLDGAGLADVGPDLNRPMSPTEYFTAPALRKLLRNPASVRNWADRKMPAFDPQALSDSEIDQIIAYLQYKAEHRK